jgi:hypothetical protein
MIGSFSNNVTAGRDATQNINIAQGDIEQILQNTDLTPHQKEEVQRGAGELQQVLEQPYPKQEDISSTLLKLWNFAGEKGIEAGAAVISRLVGKR